MNGATSRTHPKAIETRYAGCRFRSRLEARWAVFFDTYGIEWEYEPEGYLIGARQRPYLPDFWLPGERLWVEVKGSDEQLDIERLVDAAFLELGLPSTGRTEDFDREARVLVLGPVPRGVPPWEPNAHGLNVLMPPASVLLYGQGEVIKTEGFFEDGGIWTDGDGPTVADRSRVIQWQAEEYWGVHLGGRSNAVASVDAKANAAFKAARSARFEFGESGAG